MTTRTEREKRRRTMTYAVVAVVALAAVLSTTFVTGSELEAASQIDETRNPAAELRDVIKPAMAEDAVPLETLLPAIAADPAKATEEYGSMNSSGTAYFMATGKGRIVAVNPNGQIELAVEGAPPGSGKVLVQTGPVIAGSVLRDATGLVDFNDFKNQIDYLEFSTELNRELVTTLDPIRPTLQPGTDVVLTGAFPMSKSGSIMITPTTIEVGP